MQVYASVYGVTGAVSVLLVRSPLRTRRPSSSPKLNADVDPCFGMTRRLLACPACKARGRFFGACCG